MISLKEGLALKAFRKILEMREIDHIVDNIKLKKPDNLIDRPYFLVKLPYEPEEEVLAKIPCEVMHHPIILDYNSDYKFI